MKKLLILVLALIMCFSLTACNSNTSNSNDKTEKAIEITLDNWEEYFDITYGLYEKKNNFDEIEYDDAIVCDLKIKDKYSVNNSPNNNFEIDFEFELSTHLWKGNLDLTQGTYELVEEIDSFHGVVSNAVAYTEQVTITWYSTSGRIARSDILSDDDNVYIFQYPTILGLKRVQGTLYIYE